VHSHFTSTMAYLSPQFLLSAFAYLSFVVVVFCLLLHLGNHFGLICNLPVKRSSHQRKQCICCCLYPLNGHIEFYPVSSLFYFCFLSAVIALIIVCNLYYYQHASISSLSDLHTYCPIISNTLSSIEDPLYFASFPLFSAHHSLPDYLWPYIVLILLLWESLFNFWRFYDALFMAKHFRNAGKLRVFLLFSLYAIGFSLSYLAQIHVSFALFPLVVLLHLVFNIYSIVGFVSILRTQYMHFSEGSETMNCLQNRKIIKGLLHIINRVKVCSFVTTFISSVFVVISNGCSSTSVIVLLLPPLWTISCIAWSLHFVKNEAWFRRIFKSIKSLLRVAERGPNESNSKKPANGYKHSADTASTDTLSASPKSTCKLKASNSPSSRSDDTVNEMIVQPNLQNVMSTSPGMETSEETLSAHAQRHLHRLSGVNDIEAGKIELERSIPVHLMTMGFTKSISSHCGQPHEREQTRISLDVPVFGGAHCQLANMDKSRIPTTDSNDDHSDDTELEELESLQYPAEFTVDQETDNDVLSQPSHPPFSPISKTKTLTTQQKKSLESHGVSHLSQTANTKTSNLYDFDTDGFPDIGTVHVAASAIPDLYGVHGEDELTQLEHIKETQAMSSPLTPVSFIGDSVLSKQHQRCFSNLTLKEATRKSSLSCKAMSHPPLNISITGGALRNELVFGEDLPASKHQPAHRRSLSTMSGLTVKVKQSEAMAASSILDMMVNQGFFSKSGRNLAL